MEHVVLPVFDDRGAPFGKEPLEVERRLGPGRVKLLHSPALVFGIAAGDVIDLDPTVRCGYRVVERAGNVAVVLGFRAEAQKQDPAIATIIERVTAIGGWCEGGPPRGLVFTFPVAIGFPRIEAVMADALALSPGAEWWFGNVYGPDRKPLGWWEGR